MKPGRPVLYELLKEQPRYQNGLQRHGPHEGPVEPSEPPAPAEPEPAGGGGLFAAGRTVRLPTGYIFIGLAVVILIGAGAYMFGFLRGRDDSQRGDLDAYLASREAQTIQSQLREPDPESRKPDDSSTQTAGDGSGRAAAPSESDNRRGRISTPRSQMGPVLSDPRESGKNYYRLIQTTRDKAVEVAEFCRKFQLEAYAVPANNADFYYVYVLPGFTSDERSTPTIAGLREKIDDVRVHWKAETGRDDLKGYFPVLKKS